MLLFLSSLPAAVYGGEMNCPVGWTAGKRGSLWASTCYRVTETRHRGISECARECARTAHSHDGRTAGPDTAGSLACIYSNDMNEWIYESFIVSQIRATRWGTMFGLYQNDTDRPREGWHNWVSSGCESRFTKWYAGEPNDYTCREDCAAFGFARGWYDVPCDSPLYCLCEWPSLTTTAFRKEATRLETTQCERSPRAKQAKDNAMLLVLFLLFSSVVGLSAGCWGLGSWLPRCSTWYTPNKLSLIQCLSMIRILV